MVKISFVLVIAACAIMGNSILTEAANAGSSSNNTSGSIDVVVGDESKSNDASGSVATTVTPVYDNSASTDIDTTTSPTATTATPAVDDGSARTDSSSSDFADVSDDSSSSVDTDTISPSVTTATPSVDAGSSQSDSSTISSVDDSASVDVDTTSPTATTATPAVIGDGSALPDSSASSAADVGDDSTVGDTSITTDAPTLKPTMANSGTPAPTAKGRPVPISGQVKLVPGYEDCGGFGFDYMPYMPKSVDTNAYTMLTCEKGYRCQEVQGSNTYRCKEWPSNDPVPFYGQCGGGNYDGQTFCAPGAVCKYISASFSQCLPTY
ncbi:hypothetical protein F442_04788 [Phytophthora nicotianae P10297]|uniref:CBM1 domain-containing protein n=2 Tax=Phytophthora nicotianae TaxID=4792 RepID=W2ZRZ1_PHYNI|nr:hypothetical protein L917_04450 [Phytophthora nicotianae]ETP49746.1 hypothetical protein F442_04788 [Phytophthora nicotianae P10297]